MWSDAIETTNITISWSKLLHLEKIHTLYLASIPTTPCLPNPRTKAQVSVRETMFYPTVERNLENTTYVIRITTLSSRQYIHSHFTDKKTESFCFSA